MIDIFQLCKVKRIVDEQIPPAFALRPELTAEAIVAEAIVQQFGVVIDILAGIKGYLPYFPVRK